MRRHIYLVFILAVSSVAALPRSVWDGVYTKEQAQRGQTVYGRDCARCHSDNLGGGESGDRKSTRLNSSHLVISYVGFCLKERTILRSSWVKTGRPSDKMYNVPSRLQV